MHSRKPSELQVIDARFELQDDVKVGRIRYLIASLTSPKWDPGDKEVYKHVIHELGCSSRTKRVFGRKQMGGKGKEDIKGMYMYANWSPFPYEDIRTAKLPSIARDILWTKSGPSGTETPKAMRIRLAKKNRRKPCQPAHHDGLLEDIFSALTPRTRSEHKFASGLTTNIKIYSRRCYLWVDGGIKLMVFIGSKYWEVEVEVFRRKHRNKK